MSGHNYISNPDNLFEDVDDETFLRKQDFQQKAKQIEQRTLDSTQRSLGLLYETEEVGKATANELAKQRDQLEKSSRQLEEISATLRFSQKHLTSLKSVFGGLKNYLSGNNSAAPPPPTTQIPNSESRNKILEQQTPEQLYNSHPVTKIRNDQLQLQQQEDNTKSTYDQRLEQNLDAMCGSLSRLKYLATDLHDEIETQNDLIDNMQNKMEDVDIKVGKQTKDMNKLLGKK